MTVGEDQELRNLYEAAIGDIAARRIADAQARLARCVEAEFRVRDCLIFMAACAYASGDESGASDLAAWSRSSGRASADVFGHLGRVMEAWGEGPGQAMWEFLQKIRCLPWNSVGSVVGSAPQKTVEPWFFAQQKLNRFPKVQREFADLAAVVQNYVLPGHIPERPLFDRSSAILTMGSCFARELRNYLALQGMKSDWLFVPPGLNNTFAARQFVEWCASGTRSADAFWYDEAMGGGAQEWVPDASHENYRSVLSKVDGLVFTVGLAEVWYDARTNNVFWRGVPRSIYDPAVHKCRMSKVSENVVNLVRTIEVLHDIRPGLPIILTLSPIPLRATFEDRSCIVADCVSKSTLRVAIDEVMDMKIPNVSYWPSFEIVRWLGSHVDHSLFGEDGNTRHVNRMGVQLILDQFISHYFAAGGMSSVAAPVTA